MHGGSRLIASHAEAGQFGQRDNGNVASGRIAPQTRHRLTVEAKIEDDQIGPQRRGAIESMRSAMDFFDAKTRCEQVVAIPPACFGVDHQHERRWTCRRVCQCDSLLHDTVPALTTAICPRLNNRGGPPAVRRCRAAFVVRVAKL
jgi:hypothetical protein